MPDHLDVLDKLDGIARFLRRLGLRRVTRLGREVMRHFLRNSLRVEWEGLILMGELEHRNFLRSVREGWRERGTVAYVRRLVPPGGVMVDVGAHIGVYTLLSAKIVGPQGKVYAFEPDPRNSRVLKRNVVINGFSDRVEVFEVAASDHTGVVRLFINESEPSRSSFVRPDQNAFEVEVACVRLDDVLSELNVVHLIKIDVEGAELKALQGAEALLCRNPDLWLVCEINPSALAAGGVSPQDILGYLREFGFTARIIEEKTMELKSVPTDWTQVKHVNILAHRGDWKLT